MYLVGACAPIRQVPLQFESVVELNEGEQEAVTNADIVAGRSVTQVCSPVGRRGRVSCYSPP